MLKKTKKKNIWESNSKFNLGVYYVFFLKLIMLKILWQTIFIQIDRKVPSLKRIFYQSAVWEQLDSCWDLLFFFFSELKKTSLLILSYFKQLFCFFGYSMAMLWKRHLTPIFLKGYYGSGCFWAK